MQESWVK